MKLLREQPLFFFLFPVLFYLLGYTEYGHYIRLSQIGMPILVFSILVVIIYLISKRVFIYHRKAALISIFLFGIGYCFFGDIKAALNQSPLPFLSKYPVMLLLLLGTPVVTYLWLRVRNKITDSLVEYVNYLTILLCVMQLVFIYQRKDTFVSSVKPISFSATAVTTKPDIYLVVFDAYPGQISLKDYFQFDNSPTIQHLRDNGYFVPDTFQSNYNLTIGSMNSEFNMQYVNSKALYPWNHFNLYLKSFRAIRDAHLILFLQQQHYRIVNNSIFELGNTPQQFEFPILKKGLDAIHLKMLHQQLWRHFSWIVNKGKWKNDFLFRRGYLRGHLLNQDILKATLAPKQDKSPQFMYSHVVMPHDPYFTDSTGKLLDFDHITAFRDTFRTFFIDYLKYTNQRLRNLADSLVSMHPDAIIILQSDHGWRQYPEAKRHLMYNNFLAIHLPDSAYQQLQPLHSNVNLFRILLNHYFDQRLPLLPDSSFYVDEEKNIFEPISIPFQRP